MPGATLPNMGLVQGAIAGDVGTWGTIVNNALATTDAHDHTPGKGVKVPVTGLNINGDVSFGSVHAPTNLHRLSFASIAALSSNNKSLFVSSADNELYWRSNAGVNVKMTAAAALNVAAFTGGIGGDYAAVGAAVAFDDSGDRYTFKQNSPGFTWARMASGEVRIFETGSTDSVFVGLAAPAALAGSYTVTWPLALPADTRPLNVTSAGVATFSDAHGDRTMSTSALDGNVTAAWVDNTTTKAMESNGASGGASDLMVVLPLKVGDRLKSIRFMLLGNGSADLVTTVTSLSASMVGSSIGTNTTNNQAASWSAIAIDITDTTIVADASVVVSFASSAAGLMIGTITYTFDHP